MLNVEKEWVKQKKKDKYRIKVEKKKCMYIVKRIHVFTVDRQLAACFSFKIRCVPRSQRKHIRHEVLHSSFSLLASFFYFYFFFFFSFFSFVLCVKLYTNRRQTVSETILPIHIFFFSFHSVLHFLFSMGEKYVAFWRLIAGISTFRITTSKTLGRQTNSV